MPADRDRQAFLDALDSLPDDLLEAKYEGFKPSQRKRQRKVVDTTFDRTIDLHGLTRREALLVLTDALQEAKGKSLRLLVITGRGNNSAGNRGVIRHAVKTYLVKAGALYIRDFRQASLKNGGDGAFEILTR